MKFSLILLSLLASSASAFMPFTPFQTRTTFVSTSCASGNVVLRMVPVNDNDGEEGGALVPIKEETVEFTAGLLGATAGFFLGGPVLAFIVGAATNYASKMEGDIPDIVQAVSKSSIQVFNYLTKLDKKYEFLEKTKAKLEDAVDGLKAKGSVDQDVLQKVESALETTTSKVNEINDEYDLVGASMTALGVVGDLVEKAVKKAGELNEEYQLSDKALGALKTSVAKAKDAADEARSKVV